MNPSLKFILVLIISLEVSVKMSLTANVVLIIGAIIYLLFQKMPLLKIGRLIVIPIPAALTVYLTLAVFTAHPDQYSGLSLASRVYVYVLLIACVIVNTSAATFARSLEQNLHLPSKFAYGVLAALNLFPKIQQAIKQIRASGMMRGEYLSFWSPMLYFKAILQALNSAENLSQAMQTHGFVEGQKRSTIAQVPIFLSDWLSFAGLLLIITYLVWFFN
ncbi:energy-coupling factor transporter transmembrane component T family protein [Lactobacillus corticis]|uniref:Energy-coupling factor transporter transmembrane protein n=1 Tax=Lactobacillus corticis TaxID=2201249 RepID=A0A916QJQ9_9LACO|nr:energy-coupling factor transporter transmembrane component T [Lactobacillus corticis]GFZ27622.1 energy-coupling factor transporter transmembrane protein [Lactobacillus corticis]